MDIIARKSCVIVKQSETGNTSNCYKQPRFVECVERQEDCNDKVIASLRYVCDPLCELVYKHVQEPLAYVRLMMHVIIYGCVDLNEKTEASVTPTDN